MTYIAPYAIGLINADDFTDTDGYTQLSTPYADSVIDILTAYFSLLCAPLHDEEGYDPPWTLNDRDMAWSMEQYAYDGFIMELTGALPSEVLA